MSVQVVNCGEETLEVFRINKPILVEIEFTVLQPISNFHLYLRVFTQDGILAFGSGDWDSGSTNTYSFLPGMYRARCVIPGDLLNSCSYSLTVMGMIPDVRYVFVEEHIVTWEINEIGGAGGATSNRRPGIFRPQLKWSVERS